MLVLMGKYVKNILIGIDQLVNAFLFGDPDETLSSRAYKFAAYHGVKWPARFIDKLFGKGHCAQSEEKDEGQNKVLR